MTDSLKTKPIVLVTGANGMVAKKLVEFLSDSYSFRFLTRKATSPNQFEWDIPNKKIDVKAFEGVQHIIHLAGANISDRRWTKKQKTNILSSRIESAQLILSTLKALNMNLDTFISASAVGIYDSKPSEKVFSEEDTKGSDFLAEVCTKWEASAQSFKNEQIAKNVIILRLGVILAKNEGALLKLTAVIKKGLGSALGTGKQQFSWIHLEDMVRLIEFSLTKENVQGTFNAVAPEHISNEELTKKLAHKLKKRLFLPNVPAFVLKLIFGEMASVLLTGNKVSPNKIIAEGITFKYKTIDEAIDDFV